MYRGKNNNSNEKLNNAGLSLVELLVAITILAIIIVPLLHTFVSSARLNSKAQITMRATVTAENIMEEFEDKSVEELSAKYSISANGVGVYTFDFDSAQLSEYGTDLYTAKVVLDPSSAYVSYNAISVVDVEAITNNNSAVYAIYPTYDNTVYKNFEARSTVAKGIDPTTYVECNSLFFEEHLNRTITININKGGLTTDTDGNSVQLVRITVTIEYIYTENATTNALLASDTKYTETKEIFDNSSSKVPLTGIYLIYTPRYLACTNGGTKEDVIDIKNLGNIATSMYVIRQETTTDSTYLTPYYNDNKAKITISESPTWSGAYTASTPGSIKFRTNLLTTDTTTGISTLKCNLTYKNSTGTQFATDSVAATILGTRTADGKALDGTSVKNRIYKMTVEVYKNGDTSSPIVTLDGTKID